MRNFVIAGAATLAVWTVVIAPLAFKGYPVGDNFAFNLPWIVHFVDQYRHGDIYPRWLTDYSNGVGAPIFYFYAPAPFYLAAGVYSTCIGCGFDGAMRVFHLLLYGLSAAAFYKWARTFGAPALSLFGAAIYVLLPYHVADLERRSSIGEALAYVFVPLILLGFRRAIDTRRLPILGSVAYAGLIFSHLPSALLFTAVFVFYAISIINRRNAAAVMLSLSATGLIGLFLASIYVAPALALREYLVPDGWVSAAGAIYAPEKWLHFSSAHLTGNAELARSAVTAALLISTVGAAASIALLIIVRLLIGSRRPLFERNTAREVAACALALLFSWLMMTDAMRWLYVHVDAIRQVQFPWRIGVEIDLMAATIAAIAIARMAEELMPLRSRASIAASSVFAGVAAVVAMLGLVAFDTPIAAVERGGYLHKSLSSEIASFDTPLAELSPQQQFAEYPVEYRSKWIVSSKVYVSAYDETRVEPHTYAYLRWRAAVLGRPQSWIEGDATGEISVARTGPTMFSIGVSLERPATIRLRRAYFPNWRLFDLSDGNEIALRPSAEDGLMAFDLPAGEHVLTLRTVALQVERIGGAISGLSLLGLGLVLLWRLRHRLATSLVTCPILRPGKASRLP